MLARLAGLAVLIPVAAVGLTAQVVIAPWAYLLEVQRVRSEPDYDWANYPELHPDPAYRWHGEAA